MLEFRRKIFPSQPVEMSKAQKRIRDLIDHCRIRPGKSVRLKDSDAAGDGTAGISKRRKKQFDALLQQDVARLSKEQELLYADRTWSILIILQGMDASGKDGTIRHVMSGVNPQGCNVHSFRQPTSEELDHNFLWRCSNVLPPRGHIGIFNRSYYEEILVTKVHPEILEAERLPRFKLNNRFWRDRYDDINNFERHLDCNGTRILKFFLHISRDEQRRRFLERIEDSQKNWKFNPQDVRERAHWSKYMDAYESCLRHTSSECAPWYIVPADYKPVARALVAEIIVHSIRDLRLSPPKVTKRTAKTLADAKQELIREGKGRRINGHTRNGL